MKLSFGITFLAVALVPGVNAQQEDVHRKLDAGTLAPKTSPPTNAPSPSPTPKPTNLPTEKPTPRPSAPPTPRPTAYPTNPPTMRPTEAPTTSQAPSVSMAPSAFTAPKCDGDLPFCWDWTGAGNGNGRAQCSFVNTTSECGSYDFVIEGRTFSDNQPIDFGLCRDPWEWFVKCIEYSFPTCTKRNPDGEFRGKSYKNIQKFGSRGQFGIRLRNSLESCYDDCNGETRWLCDEEEDRDALLAFANWVNGNVNWQKNNLPGPVQDKRLFTDEPGCSDEGSPAPSISQAPSATPGPECEGEDGLVGTRAFCSDDMDYNKCFIVESENCGEYDFAIEGLDNLVTSDIEEWAFACFDTFAGCTVYENKGRFRTDKEIRTSKWFNQGNQKHVVQINFDGSNRRRYFCKTEEQGDVLIAFANSLKNAQLTKQGAPWSCPDPTTEPSQAPSEMPVEPTDKPTTAPTPAPTNNPTAEPTAETQAPTVCVDSYFYNPPLYILVVIDTSYSTYDTPFVLPGEGPIGDLNNDGKENTILDAEIEATLELLRTVRDADELNNSNVNIGLVTFDTEAIYQGFYDPLDPTDPEKLNEPLVTKLKSLSTEKNTNDVILKNIGYTNMDDALDKAIEYFMDGSRPVLTDATNLMVFLGDGKPNVRGDGDNEDFCPDALNCEGEAVSDDTSVPEWEQGGNLKCFSGDTNCYSDPAVFCYRGFNGTFSNCEGKEPAQNFESELKQLDVLNTVRLSIGVGASSDTQEGSALWMIDNNPNKVRLSLEPRQVMSASDLIYALKELCPENTENPTGVPSSEPSPLPTSPPTAAPTSQPSTGPTGAPTGSPTGSPTGAPSGSPTTSPTETPPTEKPSAMPTGTPTETPTVDICDYDEITFAVDLATNEATSDGGMAYPYTWEIYGIKRIFAIPDDGSEEEIAQIPFYHDTESTSGMSIGIPKVLEDGSKVAYPDGGTLSIVLDGTFDKQMELVLFDVQASGLVNVYDANGESLSGSTFEAAPGVEQKVLVGVSGAVIVDITFTGVGYLSQLNVCRDPQKTPAPFGNNPGVETAEPSASPTKEVCPTDIVFGVKKGVTDYTNLPITIIDRNAHTVTVEIGSPMEEIGSLSMLFAQYQKDHLPYCEGWEDWTPTTSKIVTAECMSHTPIAIIDIFVFDGTDSTEYLDFQLDRAEVPDCCHAPDLPVVSYSFKVACVPTCPDDEVPEPL